jgi:hypothetical protein
MAEIQFKALRTKHDSGYNNIAKIGDLEYDQDKHSQDGIWLQPKIGERIFIDCNYKTKIFTLHFDPKDYKKSIN